MGNTCAIRFIFLGAVCFHLDAYHCKVESNQTRSARHEIRVCERRLAIQCIKQNRSSVADFFGEVFARFLLFGFDVFFDGEKQRATPQKGAFWFVGVNSKECRSSCKLLKTCMTLFWMMQNSVTLMTAIFSREFACSLTYTYLSHLISIFTRHM